jgi:hypothetical protein
MPKEITLHEFEPLVKQSGLDKAENYAAIFAPFMIQLKQLGKNAAGINKENPTPVDAKLAREIRIAMAKNRTASEKKKDEAKAELLAEGNLIQGLYNVVAGASKLSEADMYAVEKFTENKEKERLAAIQSERVELLLPYAENANDMPLSTMTDEQFDTMLTGYKLQHQQVKEAAEKAEAERLAKIEADRIENERIRVDNERLKAEADAAAKALEAERAEAARLAKAEQDKADAIAKENADKLSAIEAANKAARDKAAKEQADKDAKAAAELKAAQDAAARAAAELKAKQDADDKAAAEKLAAEKKAAKAPVKDKMKVAIDNLELVLPVSEITGDIMAKFTGFKTWALQQIESL